MKTGTHDAAKFSMVFLRALSTLSLLAAATLAAAACGPPPGMPPNPVNQPVRPPPPQTSDFDGEVIGADRVAPQDRLAEGAQVVVRPGDDQAPVRLELAPGWSADRAGFSYSREEQQRMVGSSTAGNSSAESWELENGVPIFRPGIPRPRPARSAVGSGQTR